MNDHYQPTDFDADMLNGEDLHKRLDWLVELNETGPATPDEAFELLQLQTLTQSGRDWSHDWPDTTLINENYWLEYAQEFAYDMGWTAKGASWPFNHIDWQAAANELKQDFTKISDGDSHQYYIR